MYKPRFLLVAALFALLYIPAIAGDKVTEMRAVADSLHAIGRTDSAITVINSALEITGKQSGNTATLVGLHSSLGVFMRSSGNIDGALKHYNEALRLSADKKFRDNADEDALQELASLYVNMGTLHLDMAHKKEAAVYAERSAEAASRCKDNEFKSQLYGVAGSIMAATGHPEKAVKYQEESYDNAVKAGNDDLSLRAAAYMMMTMNKLGRKEDIGRWRDRCTELLPRVPSMMSRLLYFQAECSISLSQKQTRKAIAWFDSILALDGISNFPFVVYDCYNNIHTAYADLGDFRNAYEALLKGNEVRDTLYERQKTESLRDLTVKYDAKEKELALARSEAERANTRAWLAVVMTVLLIAILIFIAYAYRQRKIRHEREMEFNKLRSDTEHKLTARYIEGLENERGRMARELHDGVCNDLAAIRMHITDDKSQQSTIELIENCREQVRRISHELMPPEFKHATIDEVLQFYINRLAGTTGRNITYDSVPASTDWSTIPDDVSLEIYRIVQEAVGNAVKQASANRISVELTRTDDGMELTVRDDGNTRAGTQGGIGMRTMKQRAAAIGGTITVETNEKGTFVKLTKNYGKP